jgi:diacylglycerol O-acyltransferase
MGKDRDAGRAAHHRRETRVPGADLYAFERETPREPGGEVPMAEHARTRTIGGMTAHYPMSHADAAWLRMDRPTNLMVINSLLRFATPPDWDVVRDVVMERIVNRFPSFTRVARASVTGGHWEEDPSFDPEAHMHRIALPAPHDEAALRELVGTLAAMPLDHERPLWEAYLIEDVGDGAAVLLRIHHAIADGVALARVMLSAADGGDDGPGFGERGGHERSAASRVAGAALHPRRLAGRALTDAGAFVKLVAPRFESSHALKAPPHVARRVAWSRPLELWRVKRTARAFRVTVNDVLVAAVAGALRRHLGTTEALHALVPFNLRALNGPLPDELGNRFGLVLLELPVHVDGRVDRLWEAARRMDAIKASHEGAIAYGILDALGRAPAGVESLLIDYFSAKASMVLTNVIGPGEKVTLAGAPVDGVLVWAPCSGSMQMSVSLFSYGGKVTVGFLVDPGVIEDPQGLADAFRDELLALARDARRIKLPTEPVR